MLEGFIAIGKTGKIVRQIEELLGDQMHNLPFRAEENTLEAISNKDKLVR
ncbi:hypothetical protein [Rhizobium sp. P44RR-XXIV]|nr:hypothetical protein [Rhizobium sp. P44RR-XXIV]